MFVEHEIAICSNKHKKKNFAQEALCKKKTSKNE